MNTFDPFIAFVLGGALGASILYGIQKIRARLSK